MCAPQLAGKYDPQKEEELRLWMEDVTGKRIGENFMESLKDGVLLCECVKLQAILNHPLIKLQCIVKLFVFYFCRLINILQPGSVRKINHSSQNWHQVMSPLQLCLLLHFYLHTIALCFSSSISPLQSEIKHFCNEIVTVTQ